MTINGWLQILFFIVLVFLVTKPMGVYMAKVFSREKTFMDPVLRPVERLLYRITAVDEEHEMRWTEYAASMLLFSMISMIVLYLLQRLQGHLPLNPMQFSTSQAPQSATPMTPGSRRNRPISWSKKRPATSCSAGVCAGMLA